MVLTNVPAVVTDPPQAEPLDNAYLLPCISARSEQALGALTQSWLDHFGETPAVRVSDAVYSWFGCRRGHHVIRVRLPLEHPGRSLTGTVQADVTQGAGEWVVVGKRQPGIRATSRLLSDTGTGTGMVGDGAGAVPP